jgi:hypothetical protein
MLQEVRVHPWLTDFSTPHVQLTRTITHLSSIASERLKHKYVQINEYFFFKKKFNLKFNLVLMYVCARGILLRDQLWEMLHDIEGQLQSKKVSNFTNFVK